MLLPIGDAQDSSHNEELSGQECQPCRGGKNPCSRALKLGEEKNPICILVVGDCVRVINKSFSNQRIRLYIRVIFRGRTGVEIQFQVEKRESVL